MSSIEFLSEEIILEIHEDLIIEYGGCLGFRDGNGGLLLSAVSRPHTYHYYQGFGVLELAAVYLFAIADGHPFVDGNKRTAVASAELFLKDNGYQLVVSKTTFEGFVLAVSKHKKSLDEACKFFHTYAFAL